MELVLSRISMMYGLAAAISFAVAGLMKGMYSVMKAARSRSEQTA